jgi:translation initiation factor 2D
VNLRVQFDVGLTDSKTSLNPTVTLKSVFERYVSKYGLVDNRNHRMITLDDNLAKAMGVKNAQSGEHMTRDEVISKLRAGVAWLVSINGVVKYVPSEASDNIS